MNYDEIYYTGTYCWHYKNYTDKWEISKKRNSGMTPFRASIISLDRDAQEFDVFTITYIVALFLLYTLLTKKFLKTVLK